MATSSLIGQKVGRYEIVERLGFGGMATVYKGKDTLLGRFAAIKILSEAVATNDDAVKRFLQEARTAASLDDTDHIVRIFDYNVQNEITYIAMQLLEGGTLDQRYHNVQKGVTLPASLGEISDLLLKLAGALYTAHSRGIIHRDIKPSNVMFDMKGKPYLTDFGIVKLMDATTGAGLTGSNMTMGTPSYMSPEQWRAERITPLSDQYSLGIMIYQLIASQLPFEAPSQVALYNKHLLEPLPPITNRPEFPQTAMNVLHKATAKVVTERYADVAEFATAFDEAIRTANVVGQPTGSFAIPVSRGGGISGKSPSGGVAKDAISDPLPSVIVTHMTTAQMMRTPLFLGMAGVLVLLIAIIGVVGFAILRRPQLPGTAMPTSIVVVPTSAPSLGTALITTSVPTTSVPTRAPTITLPPVSTDVPPTELKGSTIKTVPMSTTESVEPTGTPLPSATNAPPTVVIVIITATTLPTVLPTASPTIPTVTPTPIVPTASPTDRPPTAALLVVAATSTPINTQSPTPTPVPPSHTPTSTDTPLPTLEPTATTRPASLSATGTCDDKGEVTFTVTNDGGEPLALTYLFEDYNGPQKEKNAPLAVGASLVLDQPMMVGSVRLTISSSALAKPAPFFVDCPNPTEVPTDTPTATATTMPSDTPQPTNTARPTVTPTFTRVPPTDTPIPPTDTEVPTDTPIPPTRTPRPTATAQPSATNTPDRLKPTGMQDVFTDRFTDNAAGWGLFQDNGTSATINRGLTLTVAAGQPLEITLPLADAGDFYLDATISYSLPANTGPANIFGVYFRSASSRKGYLLEFEPSSCYIFYAFLDFSFVSKQPLTTCSIKTNAQFDLKLIATGNRVTVYVNGNRVGVLTDPSSTFTSGTMGLYAQADEKNGGDFSVTFANLSVAKP